jgi:hypothetical protein
MGERVHSGVRVAIPHTAREPDRAIEGQRRQVAHGGPSDVHRIVAGGRRGLIESDVCEWATEMTRSRGNDAIPEPDAQAIEGSPARPARASYFGGGQRVQNVVFPVVRQLDRRTIDIEGRDAPLTPGMAVAVEIRTGARRILECVFSPLVETASKAMKGR